MSKNQTRDDGDYERICFGGQQVNVAHFYATNWTEDTESPTRFSFGYWTPDAVYHQGFVSYNPQDGFGRRVFLRAAPAK